MDEDDERVVRRCQWGAAGRMRIRDDVGVGRKVRVTVHS